VHDDEVNFNIIEAMQHPIEKQQCFFAKWSGWTFSSSKL